MLNKDRFLRLMSACEYSIDEISEKTGISTASLSFYLNGTTDIPAKKLEAIADMFDCTTDYLLGRTDNPDFEKWADFRNSLERTVLERKLENQPISSEEKSHKSRRRMQTLGSYTPVSVYPYNLIEAIGGIGLNSVRKNYQIDRFYKDMIIPITPDQERGLESALDTLTDREKDIILKRYQKLASLTEIGEEYGYSPERIRQIEAKAFRRLRHPSRYRLITEGYEGCIINNKQRKLAAEKKKLVQEENEIQELTERIARKKTKLEETAIQKGLSSDEIEQERTDVIQNRDLASVNISDTGLSTRSCNCLTRTGISTLKDLTDYISKRGSNWTKIRNLGVKSISEINQMLKKYTGKNADELTGQ